MFVVLVLLSCATPSRAADDLVVPATPAVRRIEPADAPGAGAFQFELDIAPAGIARAFIVYELAGVPHWTAVVRSINGLPSMGGFGAVGSSGTALQIEEINPRWLRAGVNQIVFLPAPPAESAPVRVTNLRRAEAIAAVSYTVRNLRLVYLEGPAATTPMLRLSHPGDGNGSGPDGTVVRGFVDPPGLANGPAELFVDEVYLPQGIDQRDGSFAVFVPRTAPEGEPWEARVEVVYPDGSRLRQTVRLSGDADGVDDDPGDESEVDADPSADHSLRLGEARLDVSAGALRRKMKLTMRGLRGDQLAALDAGMTNVTPRRGGFRLGPHGLRFTKPVRLRLPYDETLIPKGMTAADVRTYFFDEEAGRWIPLPEAKGEGGVIVSATDHFTDFVNATLAVPDDPSGANFAPNSLRELGGADPASQVVQIGPPEAGPTGDAMLDFPLIVPPGRRGMQPHLSVHYDSAASNGWLGVGWDLRLGSIEISTLFGVPRYDGNERYTMNGEPLTASWKPRQYVRRAEGKFDRIVRNGDGPADYWWEVTNENGTRFLYGRTAQARLRDPRSGNTFRWYLEQVIDLHGNTVDYTYFTDHDDNGEPWTEVYPARIDYTGMRGSGAFYSIDFTVDGGGRPDNLSSGRPGFKTLTRRRLSAVDVSAGSALVRRYVFQYAEGDFHKSLLTAIVATGEGGAPEFYRHTFDYYRMATDAAGDYAGFAAAQAWSGMGSNSDFTESLRGGAGAHGFVGLGDPACFGHFGTQLGGSGTDTKQRVTFADMNGDGLPDRLSDSGEVHLNEYDPKEDPECKLPGSFGRTTFANTTLPGHTSEWSIDFGLAAHSEAGFNATAGVTWVWSHANDDRVVTDINGDLRADLVSTDDGFSVRLSTGSSFLATKKWGGFNSDGLSLSSSEERSDVNDAFRLSNPLRQLVLPYAGRVTLSGAIVKSETKGDGVDVEIHHNGARIWSRHFAANDTAPCVPGPGDSCSGGLARDVAAGDSLYFLADSIADTDGDALGWSPVVSYDGRDANTREPHGSRTFVFDAREDFQLAGYRGAAWTAIATGIVRISGTLAKQATSDDVTVTVVRSRNKSEEVLFASTFAAARQITLDGIPGDFAVVANDLLYLRVSSRTTIDPRRVQWTPTVTYQGAIDPELPEKARAQIAQVALRVPALVQDAPTRSWTATSTGEQTFSVTCTVNPLAPSPATFYVQGVNRLLTMRAADASFEMRIVTTAGEPLFFTSFSDTVVSVPPVGDVAIEPPPCVVNKDSKIPVNRRWRPAKESFSVLSGGHHGWFYGEWNGNAEFTPTGLVPPKKKEDKPDFVAAAPHWEGSPLREDGTRMIGQPVWTATGFDLYHAAEGVKASRKGLNASAVLEEASGKTSGGGLSALRKTSGKTVGVDAGAGIGLSVSRGTTDTELDLLDMNGDRYPDQVSGSGVRFSNRTDGFESLVSFPGLGSSVRRSEDHNITTSIGLGINFTRKNGKGKTTAVVNTLPSVAEGIALSQSKYDLVDVNGDGLPDRVSMPAGGDTVTVQLNLGYRFGAAEAWSLPKFSASKRCQDIGSVSGKLAEVTGLDTLNALSFTRSSVRQLGAAVGPFGGGASTTLARTLVDLIDVNGDGLPDRVAKDGDGKFRVQLNLGDGWDVARAWDAPDWPRSAELADGFNPQTFQCLDAVSFSGHVEVQASLGAPICIPLVPPTPVVGLQIEVSAQGFVSTRSGMRLFLEDIDGDGLADHVFKKDGDSSVYVKRNQAARVNLLKRVVRPFGGTIDIAYERRGNHTDMPFSQWVVSQVSVNDGRGNDSTMRYDYDNDAYYDRSERENYGFGRVRVTLPDNSTVEREFSNKTLYGRHLQTKQTLRDANQNVFRVDKSEYVEVPIDRVPTAVFVALASESTEFYEGTTTVAANAPKSTGRSYAYDDAGHVIATTEFGDVGNDDDVIARIVYVSDDATHLTRPVSITVKDRAGNLLRERIGTYDGRGNLMQLEQTLVGGRDPDNGTAYSGAKNAVSTFTYDDAGNMTSSTDPSRFTRTFTYDPTTRSYPVEVRDSFGYVTSYAYDLRRGALTETTDQNGNVMRRMYDGFGRVAKIVGPYDSDSAPTLWFEYGIAPGAIAWAVAHHKDATRSDPIDSAVFIDALGRVLQTKEEAELDGGSGTSTRAGMRVSGRVTFDRKGRVVAQGQPIFDDKPPSQFVDVVQKNPTTLTYDALDRVVAIRYPQDASTTVSYAFGSLDGIPRFLTTRTDPAGHRTKVYCDVADNALAVEQTNGGRTLVTRYAYDALAQLVEVKDVKKNVTRLEYDTLGRNVVVQNPDLGRQELRFDPAGNLGAKITANLAATGQQIRYLHTFHRLDRVDYPQSPDVIYTYGDAGAPFNRANRIVTVTDESGTEELSYGKLGEIVQTVKITAALNGNTPKGPYTTQFRSDSFGRLLSVVYPDGETLTYAFDAGGNVKSAAGALKGARFEYLRHFGYDEFGQQTRAVLGNGAETRRVYDPQSRFLAQLRTSGGGRELQNLRYQMDRTGTILGIQNDVPLPSPSQYGGPVTQTFRYDDLYQLVNAQGTYRTGSNKTSVYSLTLAYDDLGNTIAKNQLHQSGSGNKLNPEKKTSYDWAYAYTGPQPHAATRIGERTFTYDLNGNQTGWTTDASGTRRTLAWNEENRLTSVADNGQTTRFLYDAAGTRTNKAGQQGETTYVNRWFTLRNGAIASKHVFADAVRIATKVSPAPLSPSEKVYFFQADHVGSTQFVTDEAGAIHQHLEYFPSGETWIDESSETQRTPYLFSGKELDEETGLSYFGARYLDARQGQWISADPILDGLLDARGLASPDLSPRSFHLPGHAFAYVANDPLNRVDPTGLMTADDMLASMQAGGVGGINTLRKAYYDAAHSQRFQAGYKYQIEKSYDMFTKNKLQSVELKYGSGGNRADMALKNGTLVEVKTTVNWEGKVWKDFASELKGYSGSGRNVIFVFKNDLANELAAAVSHYAPENRLWGIVVPKQAARMVQSNQKDRDPAKFDSPALWLSQVEADDAAFVQDADQMEGQWRATRRQKTDNNNNNNNNNQYDPDNNNNNNNNNNQ
jgi:RHS repeat-associated protein